MKPNIGIEEGSRKEISQGLSKLLADTYTLFLKTHNFHWNVTGTMFDTLHKLFEVQYNELFDAADLIAERIRALGSNAPGSFTEFARLATVKEAAGTPKALDMVKELLEGHETVTRTARQTFAAAENGADEATVDLLTQRLQYHEKTAWMLRSLLEG